jgi:negative regulator of flagellin synthesis FlgM
MKVTSNKLPSTMPSSTNATGEASKAKATLEKSLAAKAKSTADLASSSKVELSSRAHDIKKAKELATPSNDVDEAKVARLQALIDKGQYKVNAEAIADRLLDEHSKMPG